MLIILAAQTNGRNHLFAVVTPSNCLKCSSSSSNDHYLDLFIKPRSISSVFTIIAIMKLFTVTVIVS